VALAAEGIFRDLIRLSLKHVISTGAKRSGETPVFVFAVAVAVAVAAAAVLASGYAKASALALYS